MNAEHKRIWQRLWPSRLDLQIVLATAMLFASGILLYAHHAANEHAAWAVKSSEQHAQALAANLAMASAEKLLMADLASIELLLLQAARFPDVLSAAVIDPKGRVLSRVSRRGEAPPAPDYSAARVALPQRSAPVTTLTPHHLVVWQPIANGELLGWVRVEHGLESIDTRVREIWLDNLGDGLLMLVAGIAFLFLLMRGPLRSIRRATEFAQRLGEADQPPLALATSAGEVQRLGDALNTALVRCYEQGLAVQHSEARFRQLVEHATDAIFLHDLDGRLVDVNRRACESLGYTREELLQMQVEDIEALHSREALQQLCASMQPGKSEVMEGMQRRKDGSRFPVEVVLGLVETPERPLVLAMARDITERKRTEAQMRMLAAAMEQTADLVMITDRNGRIEYVNPAFQRVTGYAWDEAVGGMPSLLSSHRQDQAFHQRLWRTILAGGKFQEVLINRRKDGTLYYESKTITPIRDETGAITHFLSTGKDITEQVQSEDRLQYLSHHDTVTNLPNRLAFMEHLELALAEARHHGEPLALAALRVEQLDRVKDSLGFDDYNRLLKVFSSRLTEVLGEGKACGCLGGNEFIVLLQELPPAQLAEVAQHMLKRMELPVTLAAGDLYFSASIGISQFPDDGATPGDLLRSAEAALLRAARAGGGVYQFYTHGLSERMRERLELEARLMKALEQGEFVLHFQPQVRLTDGAITGVEALVRWQHPERGLVPPAEFVPVLEESGLIVPVGEWILRSACRQQQEWARAGFGAVRMAVNLSARQFVRSDIVNLTRRVLEETGMDPACLEYEITESAIMADAEEAASLLGELKGLGVRLAVDDFGTGYSNLGYLKRFPLDMLKIPKMFIDDIAASHEDAPIARAIIALAHSIGLAVVAEGVETERQVLWLRHHHCDLIQGYYFAQPSAPGKTRELLAPGHEWQGKQHFFLAWNQPLARRADY